VSVQSSTQRTFEVFDRNRERLRWLLDMHGVEVGRPGLPEFVERLCADRNLAMDFWALVRSLRRREAAGLSDDQVISLVVSCVCGGGIVPTDHENKSALDEFTGMLVALDGAMEANGNQPPAPAVRDDSGGRKWSRAFEVETQEPLSSDRGLVGGDNFVRADSAADSVLQGTSKPQLSQAMSHHLDEALSRLELNSLELKLHLDNLDSRMSRIEPHLEDLTLLVASTLGSSPKPRIAGSESGSRPGQPVSRVSWWDRAGAGWSDKTKTAWRNRPGWKNSVPKFKESWLAWRELVSGYWERSDLRHLAIVASVLGAALAGGAIFQMMHGRPGGIGGMRPRQVKATELPVVSPMGEGAGVAVPLPAGGSGDFHPQMPGEKSSKAESGGRSPASLATEGVQASAGKDNRGKADHGEGKSGQIGAVDMGSPRVARPRENRVSESEIVAEPTFKWIGTSGSDTLRRNEAKGAAATDGVPKAAVLGERVFAPEGKVEVDTTPAPGRSELITVSPDAMAANLLSSQNPAYPGAARLAHQEGTVVVQAVISKEGKVDRVHVVRGHPLLRRAAANAVRTWRYKPYLLNGQPVEVATTITVNFSNGSSHDSSN
jgi:TonB family protein